MSNSEILNDDRFKWIRQKVVLALDISLEAFDEYFTESLERARSAGIAREIVAQYLSNHHGSGSALFFSSNTWNEEKEVEEDMEVDVDPDESKQGMDELKTESREEDGASVTAADNAASAAAVAVDATAAAATDESKSPKKDPPVENTPGEAATAGGDAPVAIIATAASNKKIIKVRRLEIVQKCSLYMSLDKMTVEMHERTTLFFIRCFDGNVPSIAEGSDGAVLHSHFEFNVMTGEVLQGIANIMHHLFAPVVQNGRMNEENEPAQVTFVLDENST